MFNVEGQGHWRGNLENLLIRIFFVILYLISNDTCKDTVLHKVLRSCLFQAGIFKVLWYTCIL